MSRMQEIFKVEGRRAEFIFSKEINCIKEALGLHSFLAVIL